MSSALATNVSFFRASYPAFTNASSFASCDLEDPMTGKLIRAASALVSALMAAPNRSISAIMNEMIRVTKHVIGTESDFDAGRIWKITRNINEHVKPVGDKIAELVEPLGIAPGSNNVRSSGPDLCPMNARGFPGFRFARDGSDYFDLHHTPNDTLDKIYPAAMDQNVAAYLVFVWMAANSNVSDRGWPSEQ